MNNNNANNSNGVAPDCGESEIRVSVIDAQSKALRAGRDCPASKEGNKRATQAAFGLARLYAPVKLWMIIFKTRSHLKHFTEG